jgi:hypothetical protein
MASEFILRVCFACYPSGEYQKYHQKMRKLEPHLEMIGASLNGRERASCKAYSVTTPPKQEL